MQVFNRAGRLYSISRRGTMWRAPLDAPLSRDSSLPAYQSIWDVMYAAKGHPQLQNWANANTNANAAANHFGVAFVTPTLLEVGGGHFLTGPR
jgi:hypothetical protein